MPAHRSAAVPPMATTTIKNRPAWLPPFVGHNRAGGVHHGCCLLIYPLEGSKGKALKTHWRLELDWPYELEPDSEGWLLLIEECRRCGGTWDSSVSAGVLPHGSYAVVGFPTHSAVCRAALHVSILIERMAQLGRGLKNSYARDPVREKLDQCTSADADALISAVRYGRPVPAHLAGLAQQQTAA